MRNRYVAMIGTAVLLIAAIMTIRPAPTREAVVVIAAPDSMPSDIRVSVVVNPDYS